MKATLCGYSQMKAILVLSTADIPADSLVRRTLHSMVIVAGGMTGVATRPLNLSTKWMQVVSCTLQPLGKKLDRAQGRLDAVQLCPSPGNQPTALSILV